MTELPEKLCRITGIGQSAVGRPSPHTPIQFTMDAAMQAITDAGLTVADIDGITNYPMKSTEGGGISPVGVGEAMFALGIDATWIGSATHEGPGHMSAIFQAVMAVVVFQIVRAIHRIEFGRGEPEHLAGVAHDVGPAARIDIE